jgi:acetoin utilization deacetylase AcuC-like enzyme
MTFSPTSGFHHAQPRGGSGFCTFSGQVIASTKLYREKGLVGAYLDLDGHFGNSIKDSQRFVKDLNESIFMNINPQGSHYSYICDFIKNLDKLADAIRFDIVDYVVWCHGADSHEWDQLGHQCTTEEWILCSKIFYLKIYELEQELGRCIPVTSSLFGGYRDDDYNSVLSLHASDIREGCKILLGNNINYETKVSPKKRLSCGI